jgi:hypothetical protein
LAKPTRFSPCGDRLGTTGAAPARALVVASPSGFAPHHRSGILATDRAIIQPIASLKLHTSLGDVSLFKIIATLGAPLEITRTLRSRRSCPRTARPRGCGNWQRCQSNPGRRQPEPPRSMDEAAFAAD